MSARTLSVATAVLFVFSLAAVGSDSVTLRGGTELRGLILDHRSDDTVLKFRTDRGEIPIWRSTVERLEPDTDVEARYWLAREYFDETAAGLFELALWCQANNLEAERDEHLSAVLELDPNHAESRRLLGYERRGREWVLVDAPGRIAGRDSGQPAANAAELERRRRDRMALLKRRQEIVRKQQELSRTVVRIAKGLESKNADQARQARTELAEIRDPLALGPLTDAMQTATESNRLRFVEAIGRVESPDASYALAIAAVVDTAPRVRDFAIEQLQNRPDQRDRYVPIMRLALRSEKTGLIYNAADGLLTLEEGTSIPHLVGSLATPVRSYYIRSGYRGVVSGWVPGVECVNVWSGDTPVRCPP